MYLNVKLVEGGVIETQCKSGYFLVTSRTAKHLFVCVGSNAIGEALFGKGIHVLLHETNRPFKLIVSSE